MLDIFRIAWGRQFWGITENNINLSIHPSINSYKRHKTCNLQSGLFRVEHMLWIRMMQQPIFCQTRSFFCHKKNNWRKISRCKSWCQEKSSKQSNMFRSLSIDRSGEGWQLGKLAKVRLSMHHDDTLPSQVFGLENIYQSARAPQCLSNIDVQPIYWQLSFLDSMWIINIRVCLALPWWVRCRETKICKSWKDLKVPSAGSPLCSRQNEKGTSIITLNKFGQKWGEIWAKVPEHSLPLRLKLVIACQQIPNTWRSYNDRGIPLCTETLRAPTTFPPLQQKNWLTK